MREQGWIRGGGKLPISGRYPKVRGIGSTLRYLWADRSVELYVCPSGGVALEHWCAGGVIADAKTLNVFWCEVCAAVLVEAEYTGYQSIIQVKTQLCLDCLWYM